MIALPGNLDVAGGPLSKREVAHPRCSAWRRFWQSRHRSRDTARARGIRDAGRIRGFSLSAGRQMIRPLVAMLVLMVIGVGVVTVLSSTEGESAFSALRQHRSEKVATTAPSYKELSLKQIPNDIAQRSLRFRSRRLRGGGELRGAHDGEAGRSRLQLAETAVQLRHQRTGPARADLFGSP